MRSQKGFGFLETILTIGVLSTLFLSGIFLAKESLGLRKLEDAREDLSLLTKSFYAYGSIPTDGTQFSQFLNAALKTDLDPFSRQYRLILANSVNNAVASVCGAQNTDLTVRLPNGTVLSDVVAVILSAGEDGAYDTFTQNGLPNQMVVRVARNVQNPLLLHVADMFTVMTLTEFKAKNCALPAEDVSSIHYGRLSVGYSRPSNPVEGDMFYHLGNGTLEKYTNGTWVNVNWQAIVRASPEYNAGRLRIQNNLLEIYDGTNWHGVIPAVGANTIEIVDANNYIYWLPPGTTAIIKNSNRLPIAYTPVVEPSFSVSYWNNVNMHTCWGYQPATGYCHLWGHYGYYLGLRPSSAAINNGYGSYSLRYRIIDDMYTTLCYDYVSISGLLIVPIVLEEGQGENWASFTLNIRSDQRWLTTGKGNWGNSFYSAGSGTAPSNSYWLGTWWTDYYYYIHTSMGSAFFTPHYVSILTGTRTPITMARVAITRH